MLVVFKHILLLYTWIHIYVLDIFWTLFPSILSQVVYNIWIRVIIYSNLLISPLLPSLNSKGKLYLNFEFLQIQQFIIPYFYTWIVVLGEDSNPVIEEIRYHNFTLYQISCLKVSTLSWHLMVLPLMRLCVCVFCFWGEGISSVLLWYFLLLDSSVSRKSISKNFMLPSLISMKINSLLIWNDDSGHHLPLVPSQGPGPGPDQLLLSIIG